MNKKIAVIGGINMDVGGKPASELLKQDSNPGIVTMKPGGVGRNIAHNLRLLGAQLSFISAFGGDFYAMEFLKNCGGLGMDLSMSLILPDRSSSVYLYITDEKGEMQLAVSDMDIVNSITPELISRHIEKLKCFDAIVMDGNIPEDTISYVCENCAVPLYADPVSAAKAVKYKACLGKLRAVKPNVLEAEALSGERDPEKAAKAILQKGAGRVFVSLGAEGMLAAENGRSLCLKSAVAMTVNTNGAGDAATAAIVAADLMGLSLEETARFATKAAALTCECASANNPALAELEI